MRFADPFTLGENISSAQKLEAKRLMFLELTQGPFTLSNRTSGLGLTYIQFVSGETPPICHYLST
jgi:hypothetical protein